MSENPFKTIKTTPAGTKRSLDWYRKQVKQLAGLSSEKLLANTKQLTTKIVPGNMYMFLYDAKYQDTLPYWDRFPLVIPFRGVQDGFYGINLHYLPYPMRFNLLGALHGFVTDKTMNEKTRLRISWRALEQLSEVAPVKRCVKHYLADHVSSRFLKIDYTDWIAASLLPVERFEGASKERVWRDTRKSF